EALASLLGDRLQCVIVADPVRGLELLDQLRREQRGRATIAAPSVGLGATLGSMMSPQVVIPADEPLVVARLLDEVRCADADLPLVRALLGDAVVTETAAAAMELNARFPGSKVVALDGTVVSGSGLVSGGSG